MVGMFPWVANDDTGEVLNAGVHDSGVKTKVGCSRIWSTWAPSLLASEITTRSEAIENT